MSKYLIKSGYTAKERILFLMLPALVSILSGAVLFITFGYISPPWNLMLARFHAKYRINKLGRGK